MAVTRVSPGVYKDSVTGKTFKATTQAEAEKQAKAAAKPAAKPAPKPPANQPPANQPPPVQPGPPAAINPNPEKLNTEQKQTITDNYVDNLGEVAAIGTDTKGTNLGRVREISAPTIGPVANVGGINLGDTERFSGSVIDQQRANEVRAQQLELAKAIQARATGQTPSLAQLQLQDATDRTNAQQAGAIASQRGLGAALATRMALGATAGVNQQSARDAAILRLKEQADAEAQLGNLQQSIRSTDLGVATDQSKLAQDAAAQNTAAANQRMVEQSELAKQIAFQNQNKDLDVNKSQSTLDANAALANQSAFNTANSQQLDANTSIQNTNTAAKHSGGGGGGATPTVPGDPRDNIGAGSGSNTTTNPQLDTGTNSRRMNNALRMRQQRQGR